MKIKFIKDYTLTVNNPSCTKEMIGCQYSNTQNFKSGQVVSGGIRGGSLDSKNFYIDYGNYTNSIPLEYIKVLNDDGTPYDKKTAQANSNSDVVKYVFKEDFEAVGSNIIDNNRTDQEYLKLIHKFKKGDVFEGKKIPVNAGINPEAEAYNIEIITPNNFLKDGTFVYYNGVFQVSKEVVSEQTFIQKNKTNLLIAGVLVLGYFAYKKYKK